VNCAFPRDFTTVRSWGNDKQPINMNDVAIFWLLFFIHIWIAIVHSDQDYWAWQTEDSVYNVSSKTKKFYVQLLVRYIWWDSDPRQTQEDHTEKLLEIWSRFWNCSWSQWCDTSISTILSWSLIHLRCRRALARHQWVLPRDWRSQHFFLERGAIDPVSWMHLHCIQSRPGIRFEGRCPWSCTLSSWIRRLHWSEPFVPGKLAFRLQIQISCWPLWNRKRRPKLHCFCGSSRVDHRRFGQLSWAGSP